MIDPFYVTSSQFYEITKMNFLSATEVCVLVTDFGDKMCWWQLKVGMLVTDLIQKNSQYNVVNNITVAALHTSQYVSNIPKLCW